VLAHMNDAIVHRGPDSGGMYVDGRVGIAARRLAIIDLEGGDQPIANEDGSIHVVQNGEIYNYRELRAGLVRAGHRFSTSSDTEVLVHLYEDRGLEFASALRGMFAVAIWDATARRVVLARDRFGIKPLYYRMTATSLSFSSELKSLARQPDFSREVSSDALEAYLAYGFVPDPLTIFAGAQKLSPGHVLAWDVANPHQVHLDRYARPLPVASCNVDRRDEHELVDELRTRLHDSVRAHLVADVPVGVLLSGGVDSSTLAAIAATESSGPISTFSIGFDEPRFDERERARLVAKRYATDHHELVLKPDSVELLPKLATVFDEPFADASAIPTYVVSRLAREHVKVALSGEGGDELFGGYNYYAGHLLAPRVGPLASALRPLIERLPTSTKSASSFDYRAKRFVSAAKMEAFERHNQWKSIFAPAERLRLFHGDRRGWDPCELLRPRYLESAGAEPLARIMDLDLSVFLVEDMLVKTDRASMAHSLETRVPFLDTVLADFALSLPANAKVRLLSKKRLLRKAIRPYVPKAIVDGSKRGFSIPVSRWLRGDLVPMVRDILSPQALQQQGLFDATAVASIVDAHVNGTRDMGRQLWCLLMFSLWHERYATA
jgi:asparagine synthase (glutamine-hydrolysing)